MGTRQEGYPSLTAREHWGRYAIGMLVEALYILVLSALAYAGAVVARMIWP